MEIASDCSQRLLLLVSHCSDALSVSNGFIVPVGVHLWDSNMKRTAGRGRGRETRGCWRRWWKHRKTPLQEQSDIIISSVAVYASSGCGRRTKRPQPDEAKAQNNGERRKARDERRQDSGTWRCGNVKKEVMKKGCRWKSDAKAETSDGGLIVHEFESERQRGEGYKEKNGSSRSHFYKWDHCCMHWTRPPIDPPWKCPMFSFCLLSSIVFAVVIPTFSLLSTPFCSIPTSPLWLDFNPVILIPHFAVSYSPVLLSVLRLPEPPAPASLISHLCSYLVSCFLSHLFLPSDLSLPVLVFFSLHTSTHDPFHSHLFHPSVSRLFFVLCFDSLSFCTMNPEGFIFSSSMALPLSLIPHLHQLPSCSLFFSPPAFLSSFSPLSSQSHFALFSSHTPPPHSSSPPSHFSISHIPRQTISLSSLGALFYFLYFLCST